MITKARQDWTPGQTVKVGFMHLIVKACIANIGDGQPDSYILTNAAGTALFRFVPHNGCEKITVGEARAMLDDAETAAARAASQAVSKARGDSAIRALFA